MLNSEAFVIYRSFLRKIKMPLDRNRHIFTVSVSFWLICTVSISLTAKRDFFIVTKQAMKPNRFIRRVMETIGTRYHKCSRWLFWGYVLWILMSKNGQWQTAEARAPNRFSNIYLKLLFRNIELSSKTLSCIVHTLNRSLQNYAFYLIFISRCYWMNISWVRMKWYDHVACTLST